jgi:hypothetical protein
LLLLVQGELSDEEREKALLHVTRCPACLKRSVRLALEEESLPDGFLEETSKRAREVIQKVKQSRPIVVRIDGKDAELQQVSGAPSSLVRKFFLTTSGHYTIYEGGERLDFDLSDKDLYSADSFADAAASEKGPEFRFATPGKSIEVTVFHGQKGGFGPVMEVRLRG